MQEEIWKPVVGYEDYYEVSNHGRVRSLNYNKTGQKKLLRPSKTTNGRMQVILCFVGTKKHKLIHRLVAEAFIPNPENKPCIDHLDTNALNNYADNLRWCTLSENNLNPITRQRLSIAGVIKAKNQWSSGCFDSQKRPIVQLSKDEKLIKIWSSMTEASQILNIHIGDICNCCRNKRCRKTAGGYKWKYLSDYGEKTDNRHTADN